MLEFSGIERSICIFAYSFPHKKTYDFLTFLKAHGFVNVCVVGAPKLKLNKPPSKTLFSTLPLTYPSVSCVDLCNQLGFKYIESKHSDVNCIAKFLSDNNCLDLAIVAGARILSADIISLFDKGIINFHPGEIPETSGLDSFYWMIKNNASPGTTVHYIDHKVDAGKLIFFHDCSINEFDSPQTLTAKLYDNQLDAFNRLLKLLKELPLLKVSNIVRPAKNLPMSEQEKIVALELFNSWMINIKSRQTKEKNVFQACETGNLELLKNNFETKGKPLLNNLGWSPMIVAAFNQHLNCLNYLISLNENVNATNDKGTSVLMYAKTSLLNIENPNLDLLNELIYAGADVNHVDLFEKDIFHYIKENGSFQLIEHIKRLSHAIY